MGNVWHSDEGVSIHVLESCGLYSHSAPMVDNNVLAMLVTLVALVKII